MGTMIYQNIICLYFPCVKTRVMANFAKISMLTEVTF